MNDSYKLTKEDFARITCFYLADLLRMGKIKKEEASKIAAQIVSHINLVDTLENFLKLIKELSKDFESLLGLEERVATEITKEKNQHLQTVVEDFIKDIISKDTKLAANILQEAGRPTASVEGLKIQFPQFNEYLQRYGY